MSKRLSASRRSSAHKQSTGLGDKEAAVHAAKTYSSATRQKITTATNPNTAAHRYIKYNTTSTQRSLGEAICMYACRLFISTGQEAVCRPLVEEDLAEARKRAVSPHQLRRIVILRGRRSGVPSGVGLDLSTKCSRPTFYVLDRLRLGVETYRAGSKPQNRMLLAEVKFCLPLRRSRDSCPFYLPACFLQQQGKQRPMSSRKRQRKEVRAPDRRNCCTVVVVAVIPVGQVYCRSHGFA